MNEKLLTVSVAAYNVEAFLENTLGSLTDPRYVDLLEVFVIDDGGSDRSLDIAKEFAQKYPDTFHPVHKENGGYGSTVEYSVAHAAGKYFKLLDGDDWMDRDGLSAVLEQLKQCEDDVIVTDYLVGPEPGQMSVFPNGNPDGTAKRIREYQTDMPHGMWSLFYKTELLQKSHLDMPKHVCYTDQIYSTVPMAYADTVRFFTTPVYCYRMGRAEQSTSIPSRLKHAREMFDICAYLYDFYGKHAGDSNLYLKSRVARYYVVALKTMMLFPVNRAGKKQIMDYEKNMKANHPDLYEMVRGANKADRFIRLMRKTGYLAYWLLLIIPEKARL